MLKTLEFKKLAIIIPSILISIILYCLFLNTIDEFFYFKKDVVKDLSYLKIDLKDDFEIEDNTVKGFPERHQTTIINITNTDKKRISNILQKNNLKNESQFCLYQKMLGKDRKPILYDYCCNGLCREYYHQSNDYVAKSMLLTLNEQNNTIELKNNED